MEKWKDIKGFEGYQISNTGKVRSWKNGNGRWGRAEEPSILQPNISTTGYPYVILYKNKKPYTKKVHRLVGNAFKENPENKPCLNHKDGDKLNPKALNLEWCTYAENSQHAFNNGLIEFSKETRKKISDAKLGQPREKLTETEVLDIRCAYALPGITQTDLSKAFGVGVSQINSIINRNAWKHV